MNSKSIWYNKTGYKIVERWLGPFISGVSRPTFPAAASVLAGHTPGVLYIAGVV